MASPPRAGAPRPPGAASRSLAPLTPRRALRLTLRVGALAAAVQALVVFPLAAATGRFSGPLEDLDAYLHAGRSAAAGGDVYAEFVHQAPNVALTGFDYPPLVAWLLRPLGLMPHPAAAALWLLLVLACTVAGAVVVARTVLPRAWPRTELAVVASLTFPAATYNLWHGQMNPVVFLLLALALRDWVGGRQTRCGVLLGLAAGIKLAPAVLVLLLLRRRWWRGAAAAALSGGATIAAGAVLLGTSTLTEWVRDVLPVLSRDNGWLYNQSWNGVVSRLAGHAVLTVQPNLLAVRVVTLALTAATLAAVTLVVRSGERPAAERGAEFGAGVAAMLLAGTLTWYGHYVHLLIPLAASAALLARPGRRPRVLVAALVAVVAADALVAPALIAAANMSAVDLASRTGWWWPLLQLCSLPALTAAALIAALVSVLRGSTALRPAAATRRPQSPGRTTSNAV